MKPKSKIFFFFFFGIRDSEIATMQSYDAADFILHEIGLGPNRQSANGA